MITHPVVLNSSNALEILSKYDVIVDATDNVATRYLLNDACVLLKKPLVSGSALQMEGQMTVYNYQNGPCYRCIFPQPPPPETVQNCGDGGVLGASEYIISFFHFIYLTFSKYFSNRCHRITPINGSHKNYFKS